MDGSSNRSSKEADTGKLSRANDSTRVISIEQLQHLVRLLDSSDVSELELKRAAEGIQLVLRKVKLPENSDQSLGSQYVRPTSNAADNVAPAASPKETEHKVVAPFVGTFHVWAKPKGGTLVVVGDRVKAGQLVGTIQSLNVLNEVETSVAGRVVEIFVQDGQPVEYGQLLMTIDGSAGG
ncbi:MAG TPA: biotin/lipoyl-containing protein [Ktedonobacteraceae bacterium]|nr:biotin/lipoyl-containing protein [Ktedonobacteraceae bacterium]